MTTLNKVLLGTSVLFAGCIAPLAASAATTPQLGAAATYGILAQTYNNAVPGSTINGDIGYTVAPAVVPMGVHTNVGSAAPFATAIADQSTALTALNAQACTHTFPAGAIDLATDTSHGTLGVYTPGVYCVSGLVMAANLGAAGITLDGNGTYIFRINGSLLTAPSSEVRLINGANACDVFWTPVDNAIVSSLGANSTFVGTILGNTGLTVNSNVTWTGRALYSNGWVTTSVDDTITVPSSCTPPPPPPPATATLNVVKIVINDNGGIATSASFNLHVLNSGSVDVANSPAIGLSAPGRAYVLTPGSYSVREDVVGWYAASFSGDCDANGLVNLNSGDVKTCIITNNDVQVPPPIDPPVEPPVTTVPEVPNAGSGGDVSGTLIVLTVSFAVMLAGISMRRKFN